MPLAQRLARVLPPKQTSWQRPLAEFISRPGPATAQTERLWESRKHTEIRRTWASATAPRREEEKDKPSIFEELFPEQARAARRKKNAKSTEDAEKTTGQDDGSEAATPLETNDTDAIPDEVWQWLEDGGESVEKTASKEIGYYRKLKSLPSRPITKPDPKLKKRRPEPTVLVLSGTTPSLLPSDFFRIAPRVHSQSQSVEGWSASNGGIYKIVQDRDPATLAPRGRYFLYFGSSAAALAYSQEVRELHKLARRAVQQPQRGAATAKRRHKRRQEDHNARLDNAGGDDIYASLAGSISSGGSGLGTNAYLATSATREEVAALRSFSLLAPTAQLDLVMQMPAGSSVGPNSTTSSITLYDEEELDDVAAVNATTKVLVVLEDTSSSGGGSGISKHDYEHDHQKYNAGYATGSGVATVDGLRMLIENDGQRRNLPWAVSDGLNGVVPVQWLVAEQKRLLQEAIKASKKKQMAAQPKEGDNSGGGQNNVGTMHPPVALWASRVPDLVTKTEEMNENSRFSRFVVAFSDAVEARRFVRNWHRRTITVPSSWATAAHEQTAIVDTTVLW